MFQTRFFGELLIYLPPWIYLSVTQFYPLKKDQNLSFPVFYILTYFRIC